jgi:hypothetical protein
MSATERPWAPTPTGSWGQARWRQPTCHGVPWLVESNSFHRSRGTKP